MRCGFFYRERNLYRIRNLRRVKLQQEQEARAGWKGEKLEVLRLSSE